MATCEHKQPCGIRHCVDLRNAKADLARVTAERDALRAEVEAMRALLREAQQWVDGDPGYPSEAEAAALNTRIDEALRKVGG